MTRVDVHFNIEAAEKLGYCCRLVRKIFRAGHKLVVFDDRPVSLAQLDQALWTFSPLDFIPHVSVASGVDDALIQDTPVLLTSRVGELPHHSVLVNLSARTPEFFSRFERLIDLVANDDEEKRAGRDRWMFYKDRGYPITRHDAAAGSAGRVDSGATAA